MRGSRDDARGHRLAQDFFRDQADGSRGESDGVFLDSAGLDALGAHGHSSGPLGRIHPNPLQVGEPDPFGLVHRVRHVMT